MFKRGILFFTALVAILCLVSSASDARNPLPIFRMLGLIVDKPTRVVPGIIATFSPYSKISPPKYGLVEDVLKFTKSSSRNHENILEIENLNSIRARIDSGEKISVREFFRSHVPKSPTTNEQLKPSEEDTVIGLIARNGDRDLLYLQPEEFVRTYRSIKRNENCKVDGSVCLTFGTKPEASFQAQCGGDSITISTSGSLSIKLDGQSSSISMHLGAN